MKSLIPSHRENKRYLLLDGKNLKNNVYTSIKEFLGDYGLCKVMPVWIDKQILSINRESLDNVRASFAIFPEDIRIIKISGTLKGLKKSVTTKKFKNF